MIDTLLDRSYMGKHRPFISVYGGSAATMVGTYVRNWHEDQRASREWRIAKTQGFKPLYRINIKPRKPCES